MAKKDLVDIHPMVRRILTRIRQTRRARRLKQEDVARTADLSREAYLRFENGAADARISTVAKAAEALGLHLTLVERGSGLHAELLALRDLWLNNVPMGSTELGARTRSLLVQLAELHGANQQADVAAAIGASADTTPIQQPSQTTQAGEGDDA